MHVDLVVAPAARRVAALSRASSGGSTAQPHRRRRLLRALAGMVSTAPVDGPRRPGRSRSTGDARPG
jgi:hypothetical protein